MSHHTFTLPTRIIRKIELYQLLWENFNFALDDVQIFAAPFAGPIAVIKAHPKGSKSTVKPTIYIFNSAGKLISNFTVSMNMNRNLESRNCPLNSVSICTVELRSISNNGLERHRRAALRAGRWRRADLQHFWPVSAQVQHGPRSE